MLDVSVVEVGDRRALVVRLPAPHRALSWAIVNGGRTTTDVVVWREVQLSELGPTSDADLLMRDTLARLGVPHAVGLLTARDVRTYEVERAGRDGVAAACVATVGLSNVVAVGDPTSPASAPVGTINLVCCVSAGLTDEALLEANAIAVEARTAAVLKAGLTSPLTGRPATGTGTDCVVVVSPVEAQRQRFAGKHTASGSAVGAAVFGAVDRAVTRWLAEGRCPT